MTCEVCKFIAIVFSAVDPATIFQRSFTMEVYFKAQIFGDAWDPHLFRNLILSRVQLLGPQH